MQIRVHREVLRRLDCWDLGDDVQDPLDQWRPSHLPFHLLGRRLAVYCSVEKDPEDQIWTDPIFIFKRSHKKNSLIERMRSQRKIDRLRMGDQMGFDFSVFLFGLPDLKKIISCVTIVKFSCYLKQGETSRYFCLSKM